MMKIRTRFIFLVAGFTLGLALGGLTEWADYVYSTDKELVVAGIEDLLVPNATWVIFPPAGMHYIRCPDCFSLQRMFYNGLTHWQGALFYDTLGTKLMREMPREEEPNNGPPEPKEPEVDL